MPIIQSPGLQRNRTGRSFDDKIYVRVTTIFEYRTAAAKSSIMLSYYRSWVASMYILSSKSDLSDLTRWSRMVVAKVASTSTFEYWVGQQSHNKVHTQKTINGFVKSNYMTRTSVERTSTVSELPQKGKRAVGAIVKLYKLIKGRSQDL